MENKKGGGNTDKLNPLYSNLIRMASLLKERNMFDFTLHSTIYNMQNLMVDIYDYFKDKLDGKGGLIRKYLMGNVYDLDVHNICMSNSNLLHPTSFNGSVVSNFKIMLPSGLWASVFVNSY